MEIIKTEQFDSVIKQGCVVVDFFAEWCGPCKMLSPVLEKLANQYQGKVKIVKVNVDDDMDLARRFNIESIPHLILFKDGKPVNYTLGYQSEQQLKSFIESGM